MKIPPYINKGEIETTIKLGYDIRNKDGISVYLLFKKLCTVAMYGEMIARKISYSSFLELAVSHWNGGKRFVEFWDYNIITPTSTSKIFMIYDRTIKYGTMLDVEKAICSNILYNEEINVDREKLKMVLYEHSK
jgi:hypothetical protein